MSVIGGIPVITRTTTTMTMLLSCLCCCLLIVGCLIDGRVAAAEDMADSDNNNYTDLEPGKHPVFLSELKLRNSVVAFNNELRQLKRDFVKHITDIYLSMKLDPNIGFAVLATAAAKPPPPNAANGATKKEATSSLADKQVAALVQLLMAEEFADIVIKKHIIQRRLLAGLKVAFVKFLPLDTLRQLVKRLPDSFGWLRSQNQVDLKPRFPEAKENQYVQLYSLIELRAKARAADDILALTSDNIKRILKSVQMFLIERKQVLPEADFDALSRSARRVLRHYQDEVTVPQRDAPELFQRQLEASRKLAELAGGEEELVKAVDGLINSEVLDIDLSSEANRLAAPPTINEPMIANIEPKWIPQRVLKWLEEDRKLLMANERVTRPLAYLSTELDEVDAGAWCEVAVNQIRG